MSSPPIYIYDRSRFFTISTAGHVDHGKTSLLRALTGIDPDRLKEEKERQMTTDLGFAHLQLDNDVMVGFVDVPGHGKFLKNMLAGVGGIDMALLVVAADEGPMPQTIQHVRILSFLGVRQALVALTKTDLVDDATHLESVKSRIADLLEQHDIELVELVPISSTRKIGFDELRLALRKHLQVLPARDAAEAALLPVDRVFTKQGFGTVITGTLVRGKLAVGDQIIVAPAVGQGRVRRLETFGQQVASAVAGQRVACNLVLKDGHKNLVRGDVVLGVDSPSTRTLIVKVLDRPRVAAGRLSERLNDQPIRLYHGTAEYHGHVRWAKDVQLPDDAAAGHASAAMALVALSEPAVVQAQDRFVMRLSDETIFGGEILLRDRPRWLTRADAEAIGLRLLANDDVAAVLSIVKAAPNAMVRRDQLAALLVPAQLDPVLSELTGDGRLIGLAGQVMEAPRRKALSEQIAEAVKNALAQECKTNAAATNAGGELVRSLMHPRLDRQCFSRLVEEEVDAKRLLRSADKLSLPVDQNAASAGQRETAARRSELSEKVLAAARENFCLELKDLATMTGADIPKIKSAAQSLVASGDLLLINYEFVITAAELARAHQVLASIWTAKRNIAPTDFREELHTSRKYAMAVLQHFDDTKVTRRTPTGRILLKPPPLA